MLIQLHHQFKDRTEMQAQKDVANHKEMRDWVAEIKLNHPIPKDAIWMACNEESNDFVRASV